MIALNIMKNMKENNILFCVDFRKKNLKRNARYRNFRTETNIIACDYYGNADRTNHSYYILRK